MRGAGERGAREVGEVLHQHGFNLYALQSHLPLRRVELDLFPQSCCRRAGRVLKNVIGWRASPRPRFKPLSLFGPLTHSWNCLRLLRVCLNANTARALWINYPQNTHIWMNNRRLESTTRNRKFDEVELEWKTTLRRESVLLRPY